MSLERTETVDASVIRDGWAVLTIHHFGEWDDVDEQIENLRRKIAHYLDHIQSPAFLERAHRIPVRIELVCTEEPPAPVEAVCIAYGVTVLA